MNLPETAKLQEIYEKQRRAAHVSRNLQIILQKHTNMTKQNTSHQQEELRSLETIQTTMAAR